MHHVKLLVYRMHPDVQLPTRGTPHSIGVDVHAYLKSEHGKSLTQVIPPNTTRMIRTGLVVVIEHPIGGQIHALFVCSRSGMATKGLFVTNAPGVIDPDYRGEIKILLHNGSTENQWVKDGDRVAQLVALPIPIPLIAESTYDLRKLQTERGEAGFGSTGQ